MENVRKRKGRTNCINDQRGFTMVELLIGIVILSLVIIAIGGFIVVGSRSYAAANTEIILQQEAQLAMNQISDVIIDTTRSVNYAGYNGSGWDLAEKDADFTSEVTDKSLILCNGVDTVDADGNVVTEEGSGNKKNYQFYYNKDEETLYYSEIAVTTEGKAENFPEDDRVVLAEYVTDFSVDLTQVVEKRVVQISMTYESNHKTYTTSNNITIRNKVGVNEIDVENLDKRVELRVIPKETSVILEPGEKYHFSTPKVTGKNVIDKSVTWSLSDETSHHGDTILTDTVNGIIKIAPGERENFFKVTITTNATDSEGHHATADVIVYVKRVKKVDLYKSADNGDNEPNEISPGCTFTITANVSGNKLGSVCSKCGDSTEIDKQVVYEGNPYGNPFVWLIFEDPSIDWFPTKWLKIIDSDAYSATFYVEPDAPVDEDNTYMVEISAMSFLSTQNKNEEGGREYDAWEPGVIDLYVVPKKQEPPIHIDFEGGDLEYGLGDKLLNMVGVDSDDPSFLIIVRIKEDPNAPASDDMVMVYATEGNNARLKPDTWLLNMNKEYTITLQVIDILSDKGLYKNGDPTDQRGDNKTQEYYDLRQLLSAWSNNQVEGTAEHQKLKEYVDSKFWPEYTGNLDSSGCYNGGMYPKYSNLFPGRVSTPKIGIISYFDDKDHYDGVDVKTMYTVQKGSLFVPADFGKIIGTWASSEFRNFAFYNVYSGESGNSSEWKRLYYLPENDIWGTEGNDWINYKSNSLNNKYYQGTGIVGNTFLFESSGLPYRTNVGVKVDFNAWYGDKKSAVGTYHYVPGFAYVNEPANVYLKISDNYEICDGKQYYYDYKSTVNFTLKDGGNLRLWAYTNDGFKYGQIFFPEPSDPRQFTSWQTPVGTPFSYNNTYLLDDNGVQHDLTFPEAMLEYNAAKDRYELKLYYKFTNSWGVSEKCYAGTFYCSSNGTEWTQFEKGTYDEQLKAGNTSIPYAGNMGTVKLIVNGNETTGIGYMPLPSDSKFTTAWEWGIVLGQEGTQIKEWPTIKFQAKGDTNPQDLQYRKLECTYDKNTDTYTIELFSYDWNSGVYTSAGKFKCTSNGNAWTQIN